MLRELVCAHTIHTTNVSTHTTNLVTLFDTRVELVATVLKLEAGDGQQGQTKQPDQLRQATQQHSKLGSDTNRVNSTVPTRHRCTAADTVDAIYTFSGYPTSDQRDWIRS
jgi:hypothetical protein